VSLALYRKYRPATFAQLKGQEHVAEPLQQALRNGRINHAYLFSGPRGCGKTSSARILARSLNCEQGPTPDPCGVCDSCVALGPSGSGHIDVIEIDAASHGGVDDARDLRERAFFAPVAARFKIYIIDEAHMVTREGFNALLKLVEEPPHLKFVFATTEPEKVIGTIRSRTHHYPFRLIPPGVLKDLLEEILTAENVPFETAALPLVVRAGAGSARDSLSILDQLLAGSDDAGITYARAVSLLGYTDASLLDEVVDAFAARDGAAVFAAIDRVIESGQDPRRFAADLLGRFRDLVVLANVPEAGSTGLLDHPSDELERMQRQSTGLGRAELTRAADLLHTGLTEMRGATSPRLLLELICARILLPGAYDDESSLLTRLERMERRLAAGGVEPVRHPQAVENPPTVREAGSQAGSAGEVTRAGAATGTGTATAAGAVTEAGAGSAGSGAQPAESVQTGGDRAVAGRPGASRSSDGAGWPESAQPGSGGAGGSARPASRAASGGGEAPAAPVPDAPSTPSSAPVAGGFDVAAVRRSWPDILETVKRKSRVAWMVLMEGVQVAGLEGNLLTLSFDNEGKRKGFTGGGRDVVVREALKEFLGVDWRIDTVTGGTLAPSGRSGGAPARPSPSPGPAPGVSPPGAAPSAGSAGPAGAGDWPTAAAPGGSGAAGERAGSSRTPAGPAQASTPGDSGPGPQAGAGVMTSSAVPAPRPRQMSPRQAPPRQVPPDLPPPPEAPMDESDEVDPDGDRDAGAEEAISGMALIQRELGGQIIKEIDNT